VREVIDLARFQPKVLLAAVYALLNAALSLPQLLAPDADIPEIRRLIERAAYERIAGMEPPA
jgi:hypothetical protein